MICAPYASGRLFQGKVRGRWVSQFTEVRIVKKASEYRAHAQDCRMLARRMKTDAQRETLLQMAMDWDEMAIYRARLITLHPELAKEGEHQEEGLTPQS